MRLGRLPRILLIATLAPLLGASGQQSSPQYNSKRPRYRFVDLGTFGGPDSIIPFSQRVINKQGTVIGDADTSVPDPFAPNCAGPNCLVQQGFKWHHGSKIRLRGLVSGLHSAAQAINDQGVVSGDAQTGVIDPVSRMPNFDAVLWKHGEVIDLGTLGGAFSGGLSLNNREEVVGASLTTIPDPSSDFGTEMHAFLWRQGVMHDLGTLGGTFSFGTDVNDRAQAGGVSLTAPNPETGNSEQHAFLWEKGRMIDLGTLGGTSSDGLILNSRGQAAGSSTLEGDLDLHAFIWNGSKLKDIGTLGGTFSAPTWLSDRGHVVGLSSTTNDEAVHGFLWKNGTMVDLGTLNDDVCSVAWGANSKGQVVGISSPLCVVGHAFLWENGSMVDLNTLIPAGSSLELIYAEAINDAGEIIGIGVPHGVAPEDVETLGHAYALIPLTVDSNSTESPKHVNSSSALVGRHSSVAHSNGRAVVVPMLARMRERLARRYRFHGMPPGRKR